MRDLFLRFPDEASAKTHLYTIEYFFYKDEEGLDHVHEVKTSRYKNLDIIGFIDSDVVDENVSVAEVDREEPYIPVTYIPLPGWHVNIRALPDEDTASLEQFVVRPTNPRRVWA